MDCRVAAIRPPQTGPVCHPISPSVKSEPVSSAKQSSSPTFHPPLQWEQEPQNRLSRRSELSAESGAHKPQARAASRAAHSRCEAWKLQVATLSFSSPPGACVRLSLLGSRARPLASGLEGQVWTGVAQVILRSCSQKINQSFMRSPLCRNLGVICVWNMLFSLWENFSLFCQNVRAEMGLRGGMNPHASLLLIGRLGCSQLEAVGGWGRGLTLHSRALSVL